MHIHPSSPNSSQALPEELAATIIQAIFRGYRVRKQLNEKTKQGDDNMDSKIQKNITNLNENKIYLKLDEDVEEQSATKIQAGVRGFLVRKKQKLASDAATKIQATFRGFKVRKNDAIAKK